MKWTMLAMATTIIPWGLLCKYTVVPQMVGLSVQIFGIGLMLGIGLSGKWMDI